MSLTSSQNANLDAFARKAADMMMVASVEWLRASGKAKFSDAEIDALLGEIRPRAHAALDQGMADAKAALDCGMVSVAETTFAASMKLAGIAAARAFFLGLPSRAA